MGGDYTKNIQKEPAPAKVQGETIMTQPPPTTAPPPPGAQKLSELEIHTNKGEVHFHDRKNGLKVAMTMGDWYMARREISRLSNWLLLDTVNNTFMTIYTVKEGDLVESYVAIEKVRLGPTISALVNYPKP